MINLLTATEAGGGNAPLLTVSEAGGGESPVQTISELNDARRRQPFDHDFEIVIQRGQRHRNVFKRMGDTLRDILLPTPCGPDGLIMAMSIAPSLVGTTRIAGRGTRSHSASRSCTNGNSNWRGSFRCWSLWRPLARPRLRFEPCIRRRIGQTLAFRALHG